VREGWELDTEAPYPRYRYKDTPWVVYSRSEAPRWTAYKFGELSEKLRFETITHAMIYAETMEAVGA
jgi:hypothetical protein